MYSIIDFNMYWPVKAGSVKLIIYKGRGLSLLHLSPLFKGTPSVESPLNTRELSLVEEETQKRIKLLLEGMFHILSKLV